MNRIVLLCALLVMGCGGSATRVSELESKVAALEKELSEAQRSAVPFEIRTPLLRSRADLERAFSQTIKVSFVEGRDDGGVKTANFGGGVLLQLWGTSERLDCATLVGPLNEPDTAKILKLLLVALVPKWDETEHTQWFVRAVETATEDMSVCTEKHDVDIRVIKSSLGSNTSFCIVSFQPYTYHKTIPTNGK